jgi:oligopeptidase B
MRMPKLPRRDSPDTAAGPSSIKSSTQPPAPPHAERRPHVDMLHGDARHDDYHWLRNRDDPAVLEYLKAENAYTEAMTAHTASLRETLYSEMLGRIKETDAQVPELEHGWYYYSRTEQGESYPIYARVRAPDALEQIVFDQNEEARPHAFHQLGGMSVSPDGNLLAILEDTSGYEDFVLRIRDLRTMEWLPERIEKLSWGLAWASDNTTLFYVRGDEAKRPAVVWRHVLGAPAESDVEVFRDDNVAFNVSIHRSRSGAYIFFHSSSFTQDEWSALDASNAGGTPFLIAARAPGVEYQVDHGGDWFYITTNRDSATNFKVMRAPVNSPANWHEFLTYRPEVFIEEIDVFARWMVRAERREGLRHLVVRALDSGAEHDVTFDEEAYGVDLGRNPEFELDTLRFTYSSLVTPPSVYDYDMQTHARELRKRLEVPGGYDPSNYSVARMMVRARDGAHVPVSMVYRGTLERDGGRPLLLYAYGSYGATMEPTFNSNRFSLVDRGFVYAIAHVRGGQELGRTWYDDGKMLHKLNTFHDFIDVAERLVADRYTSPERLVAHGGSAGGLLMGAIANMRPDLFRAIIADVPFVDVINTMLDASIPLTAQEWEQWGNPQNEVEYRYMLQYSPYDNVRSQPYPWMLVMSGINDSRVAFWEPAKWVAKLRTLNAGDNPLLLHMLLGAGHGGSSGRYERLRETAFRYAFCLDAVGLAG